MKALIVYFNISFAIGALVSLLSGAYVLYHNAKQKVNQFWAIVTIFGSFWGLSYLAMINTSSNEIAFIANRSLHIFAIITLASFFIFALYLTNQFLFHKKAAYLVVFLGVLLITLISFTDLILQGTISGDVFSHIPVGGNLFWLFSSYLISITFAGCYFMYSKVHDGSTAKHHLNQIRYVLLFSAVGWIGGGSTLLLTHGIDILPYPIILWAFYPFFATYAIVKLNLFNTKAVTAEILTAFLWVFLAVRLILSSSTADLIINGVVLALMIPAGILLIRGITKEVKAREKAEELTKELQEANQELKYMDKQKSKMLSIASHQFRSPLTSIEGYASMMKEGTYGEVPEHLEKPINRIFKSSKQLSHIVDDFLNISRIEQDRMEYDFKTANIQEIVENVIEEITPTAHDKGLEIEKTFDGNGPYKARVDVDKFTQVITNLIDNAIKYTQEGKIIVHLTHEDDTITVAVEDSGIGIDPEDKDKIFEQFSRADEAEDADVVGSGLGLYIAKQIVQAHDGEIWATSPGKGKGSTFHVKIPAGISDGE